MSTLLFLDVDGPLIPFGASPRRFPDGYPTYRTAPSDPAADAHPLLARVNPAHGPRLAALGCDLVWATTWTDDANDSVAPRLGLPALPVVHWPDSDEPHPHPGLHWKTPSLITWAAGRPFVWLDDELTEADRAWVSATHPAPALLHRVDAHHGLTEADFAAVEEWLGEV
ncbi:HAD domain-containing protein [Streptomyces goshikiensis]|uniref:HAD domain-containing protein n=1 Tax=Streptomyces goshikiensis TaxID=1942 RepID=UPI00367D7F88